jgi:hypothetical protein
MRNISDKSFRENQNTHFVFSNLRNNVEKYCTAGQTTDNNINRRVRIACWITKAPDTHSDYVILIAFPRQELLRERVSKLRLYVCLPPLNQFEVLWLLHKERTGKKRDNLSGQLLTRSRIKPTTRCLPTYEPEVLLSRMRISVLNNSNIYIYIYIYIYPLPKLYKN